jgi:hypothetical protein
MRPESFDAGRHPGGSDRPSNSRASLARRCLQLALVLLILALALTQLTVWGERRAAAAAAWRDPANDIQPQAIAPDLALLSLAAVPDEQMLALAIEANELETVRALLAFSADLTDQQRMNGWLWLACRYQEAGQTGRAAQAYRLAGEGAILSGHLPDLLRVETLLTVGQQLITLHDKLSAHYYLSQVALIGAHAPHLTDYARRWLLEQLIPYILQAGGKRDDWLVLAKAVKNGTAQGGNLAFTAPNDTPGKDALLMTAQDSRQAAAAALLSALTLNSTQPSADTTQTDLIQLNRSQTRQALLAEDAAIASYLARETGPAAQETRLRWLLFKRRVAAGGAGAGLMPEWETSRAHIDAALTAAWSDWLALHTAPTSSNPRTAASAVRQAIMAAHWGLYPDASLTDLVHTLQSLDNAGDLRLTIIEPGQHPVVGWSEN